MTKKQNKILEAALKLFAELGYNATSTSKIAKEAKVSEGLIFRHFKNKEGLLSAILEKGAELLNSFFQEVLKEENPKETIKKIIEIPFNIGEEHNHLWKLIYSLKWQADIYDDTISLPIKNALITAFKKLEYSNPEIEAEIILILLDGISTAVLLREIKNKEQVLETMLEKYTK